MSNPLIGKHLRSAREASGRSLREVARSMGLSHVYVGEVERGMRGIGPASFERWATAYGCPVSDLTARYVCPHCGGRPERTR